MPFNKVAELLIPALSGFIAFYAGDAFTSKGSLISWSVSALTLILSFIFFSFIWFSSQRTGIFDKRFLCAGNWIQVLNKNGHRHISLVEIEHLLVGDRFVIRGQSFTADDLDLYAHWTSESVSFTSDTTLAFIHRATIVGKIGDITGLTKMEFFKDGKNYYGGSGQILDDDENVVALNFNFERRTEKITKDLIGKAKIETVQDRDQFLSKFASLSTTRQQRPSATAHESEERHDAAAGTPVLAGSQQNQPTA